MMTAIGPPNLSKLLTSVSPSFIFAPRDPNVGNSGYNLNLACRIVLLKRREFMVKQSLTGGLPDPGQSLLKS